MSHSDKELGMDRDITRRDFVNGVALVAGSLTLPASALAAATSDAEAAEPQMAADYYPPTRTGLRGSHPGSFEAAHQLRDTRRIDTAGALRTGETYDLIVVGGGLSGLSAAHFFHKNVARAPRCWCSTTTMTLAVTPSAMSYMSGTRRC